MQKLCKVKTEEQIKQTLDRYGRCSGVSIVSAMYRHCGEVCIARSAWGEGAWHIYDRRNRPICSDWGFPWTWATEWLDFNVAADENDLTKTIEGGLEK